MLNGLPTFFMAENPNEMKLKLHAKIYHGKLGTSSVKFYGISAESRTARPRSGVAVYRHSGGSFEVRAANSDPARPHSGPEVFAWTLRALWGVLKASFGAAGPRFGASRVPAGIGKKDYETARDYTITL